MNLHHQIARFVMHMAMIVAPSKRSVWIQAMNGELCAMEDTGETLKWSAGCLLTAIGWRIRSEAFYILGLAFVPLAFHRIFGFAGQKASNFVLTGSIWPDIVDPFAYPNGPEIWMAMGTTVSHFGLALIAFALCLHRPGRTIFTGAAVWLMSPYATMFASHTFPHILENLLVWKDGHPSIRDLTIVLTAAGFTIWSSMVGALAAWAVQRNTWPLVGLCLAAFVVGIVPGVQFWFSTEDKAFLPLPFNVSALVSISTSTFVIVGGLLSLRNAARRKMHDSRLAV